MDEFDSERCDGCPVKVVCRCLKVTEQEVVRGITRMELRTIQDLKRHVGAGDGCTCCHSDLHEYLERFSCAAAVGS